jgi:hypothetical protein
MKNVALTKKILGQSQKLIVDGEVWEDSSGYKAVPTERISASFRGTSFSKIAKLTVRQLSAHFEQITFGLPR